MSTASITAGRSYALVIGNRRTSKPVTQRVTVTRINKIGRGHSVEYQVDGQSTLSKMGLGQFEIRVQAAAREVA